MNIKEAIQKLEEEGNRFISDYEKHFKDFCEFKEWITPFEMLVAKKGIVRRIVDNLVERYDGIRENLKEALEIDLPREKGLPSRTKLVLGENNEWSFNKK